MILVTGGTGMIGAHILLALAKEKDKIRAIYRRTESLNYIKYLFQKLLPDNPDFFNQIEWVKTDLSDLGGLDIAFKGVKLVYHCAAKVSFAEFNEQKLIKTNVEGTTNIVNLCIKYRIKKIGYVSSIASIGANKNVELVKENHTWSIGQKHTPYAYSKYGAELEVWRAGQEGIDVVIVNPGVILGPHFWHRSSGTIFKYINKGLKYYTLGNISIVGLNDVVKSLILLMKSPIRNERFILVVKNMKQKKLLDKIAIKLNKEKPYLPVTKSILYILFILDKIFSFLKLKKKVLSLALIDELCNNTEYDGSKILSKIDFTYTKTDDVINQIVKIN